MKFSELYPEEIKQAVLLPFPDNTEILLKAINTYGKNMQIDVAIEEMSELTKALFKERRHENFNGNKGTYRYIMITNELNDNISEEMADVIIMTSQLLIIFENKNAVQNYIDKKIKRLAQIL